jgi:hypothetical protein
MPSTAIRVSRPPANIFKNNFAFSLFHVKKTPDVDQQRLGGLNSSRPSYDWF